MNNDESSGMSRGTMIAMGAAALGLAAAGYYYFYYAEEGDRRRRMMKSWMSKIRADVLEQIENLWSSNQEGYSKAMGQLKEKYTNLKNMDPAEIAALALRLRKHWREIQDEISSATSKSGGKKQMGGAKRSSSRKSSGRGRSRKQTGSQSSSS